MKDKGGVLMCDDLAKVKKTCPLGANNGNRRKVRVGNAVFGGDHPLVVAGPCAVESREQLLLTAKAVKEAGGVGLRGGIFKPRSSPYSFQGLGQEGLDLLQAAKTATGLFIVAEVMSSEDIEIAQDTVDVFQVGSRNMQNFSLLKLLGRQRKPVILKRGLSATVMEWLQAAEYILKEGNPNVILCERGIRTFETMTRNTLDINGVALAKTLSNLPVIVDPSHGTGRRDLILPAARAALAVGADGLMIEVHPQPETALSDGAQSLDFQQFREVMKALKLYPAAPVFRRHKARFEEAKVVEKLDPDYQYLPISRRIPADLETPIGILLKAAEGPRQFLLETVIAGERPGRYSYIGWDPIVSLRADDSGVYREDAAGERKTTHNDILQALAEEFTGLKAAPLSELTGFTGGAVGYLGYEYVRRIEHLPTTKPDPLGLPEAFWLIPRRLVIFDHVSHEIILNYYLHRDEPVCRAQQALDEIERKIATPITVDGERVSDEGQNSSEIFSTFTRDDYKAAVKEALAAIHSGEVFQLVLSQRFTTGYTGDPLTLYRSLRRLNPSPYLFFIRHEQFALIGSSPESMVRLEDGEIQLCPIAGTRPRSRVKGEDLAREQELLADPKERAEHIMLVDLGRNDLGRVAAFGTVRVEDLMHVERYSHVMHIVSSVKAQLAAGKNGIDLLRAVFPAGTVSGAPKVRAMQLIDQLEPVRRGAYAGAVGYIGFNGNLDTGIIIRTIILKDGLAHIQAGAGIVADSDPEKEFLETVNKAQALLQAVKMTKEEGEKEHDPGDR